MPLLRLFLMLILVGGLLACGTSKKRKSSNSSSRKSQPYYRYNVQAKQPEKKTPTQSTTASKPQPKPQKPARSLQNYVEGWIGTPYRYGGNDKSGVDCSGFVTAVFRDFYKTPLKNRRSQDIYDEVAPISKSQLREGDLVFFKIKHSRIDHMGIYLGNQKFVHASSSRGVIISSLESPYYERYFYKAGRKR